MVYINYLDDFLQGDISLAKDRKSRYAIGTKTTIKRNKMKIEFTKEQYEQLMKLVHVGNYIINGMRDEEEEIVQYNEIENYINQHAKDFGLNNLVEEEDGKFYPSQELLDSEELETYMEEHNDEIFWDELADRLAVKAILDGYDEEALEKMTSEEQFFLRMYVSEQFEGEFEEAGLDNVTVSGFEPDLEMPEIPKY